MNLLCLVSCFHDDSKEMDENRDTAAANVVKGAKSHDLPDKCMSEIQAKLVSLDSHTLLSLETPAINTTKLS